MKEHIRRSLYLFLGFTDKLMGFTHPLITVFCYHSFTKDNWYFSTDPLVFEEQVKALSKTYSFITVEELQKYFEGKTEIHKPSVVLTFDDGYRDVLNILPITRKYKLYPTVFLVKNPLKANKIELGTDRQLLTKRDIKELEKEGWSFGSHTSTHEYLPSLSKQNLQSELNNDDGESWIAYPKGGYTNTVISVVRSNRYKLGFSMDDGIITRSTNQYVIPRIGINRSHTLSEVLSLNSQSCILLRKFLKKYGKIGL